MAIHASVNRRLAARLPLGAPLSEIVYYEETELQNTSSKNMIED